MNPLEFLDALETIQLDKIQLDNKNEYTKEEVINLLKEVGLNYRKAIFNGEYIFNLESSNEDVVVVDDKEYTVQKLVTSDDKYLLFLQINNEPDNFTQSDLQILSEEINKSVKKVDNIAGVLILQPGMDISLITAKLETNSYADTLNLTDEDRIIIQDIINNADSIIDDTSKKKYFTKYYNYSSYYSKDNTSSTSIYTKYY